MGNIVNNVNLTGYGARWVPEAARVHSVQGMVFSGHSAIHVTVVWNDIECKLCLKNFFNISLQNMEQYTT